MATPNRAQRRSATRSVHPDFGRVDPPLLDRSNGMDTLDDLESESQSEDALYTLTLADDEVITIGDPADVEYSVIASGDINAVLAQSMSEEDWEKFIGAGLTGRQVRILFQRWRAYYGIPHPGE